jgi:hypothetical protein
MAPQTRTTAKNPKNPDTPADTSSDAIKVQRTAKCRTLGNGSLLTYEVGANSEGQPHVRMTAAAGGGFFSQEWIALSSIITALDAWPSDRPLTSNALAPLFRGKSANNPSFLAAVLVAEGVLQRKADRKRHLERCEATDPAGGFDGFGGTQPAQKRQRKPRAGKTAPLDSDKTDTTSPASKSSRSHTDKTDKTPARKTASQRKS